jgi:hypothetical protein
MYNVNQMMGLTGRRFRPSWDTYYAEKSKALPNMMALASQKQYNDKMSGLEEDRMRLQENYYDKQQDNMKTGNWINTASLGLQGLNTANQLAGGNLGGALVKGAGAVAKHAGDAWDAISEGFSSLWG